MYADGRSDSEIAEVLKRTEKSVSSRRLKYLKLKSSSRFWTYKEDEIMRKYYPLMSALDLSKQYLPNKSRNAIVHHAKYLGFNTIVKNVIDKYYPTISKDEDINNWSIDEKELFTKRINNEQDKYPLGVCLSKKVHEEFHNEYGRGSNTIEQFQYFINNNYPQNNFKIVTQ